MSCLNFIQSTWITLFLASVSLAGQMDGEWVSISSVRAGVQQAGASIQTVIKDGKINTVRDGKHEEEGIIHEALKSRPHRYILEMKGDDQDADKKFLGIFTVSGDTMLTCVNIDPGGEHPVEFKSSEADGRILTVWQRKSGSSETELDRVYDFLQANVANRTLAMATEGMLAEGRVGYTFRRESTLCNLFRSHNRLYYDVIYVIRQKKWDISEDSTTGDPRTEDRMLVVRYKLGLKKSTGEVIGHSETITTTRRDWGGSSDTIRMKVEDAQLHVERKTGLYDDYFDRGDTFYPGASDEHQILRLENGKLIAESRSKVYRVNPKTLERDLIDDRSKPTVETEVSKLPLE